MHGPGMNTIDEMMGTTSGARCHVGCDTRHIVTSGDHVGVRDNCWDEMLMEVTYENIRC